MDQLSSSACFCLSSGSRPMPWGEHAEDEPDEQHLEVVAGVAARGELVVDAGHALGGLLTLLFIVEKVWLGEPPKTDVIYSDQAAELE